MPRPNFGHLWSGPWPYKPHEGVGLEFSGVPTDPVVFAYILQSFSCPSPVSYAIAWDLKEHGTRKTTVKNIINFLRLAEELQRCGVTVRVCPPI